MKNNTILLPENLSAKAISFFIITQPVIISMKIIGMINVIFSTNIKGIITILQQISAHIWAWKKYNREILSKHHREE